MGAIQNRLAGPVSEELELVRAAKGGDDSAFEELVRRYDRNVFRIAQHITQNREDAEDVVQEAFLKAYGNLSKFQEQSKFYTWLVRIAVNEALMKLRRRKPSARFPWMRKSRPRTTRCPAKSRIGAPIPSSSTHRPNWPRF